MHVKQPGRVDCKMHSIALKAALCSRRHPLYLRAGRAPVVRICLERDARPATDERDLVGREDMPTRRGRHTHR
eukprot:2400170-Lingulodinium_polyedra.AAC.1